MNAPHCGPAEHEFGGRAVVTYAPPPALPIQYLAMHEHEPPPLCAICDEPLPKRMSSQRCGVIVNGRVGLAHRDCFLEAFRKRSPSGAAHA